MCNRDEETIIDGCKDVKEEEGEKKKDPKLLNFTMLNTKEKQNKGKEKEKDDEDVKEEVKKDKKEKEGLLKLRKDNMYELNYRIVMSDEYTLSDGDKKKLKDMIPPPDIPLVPYDRLLPVLNKCHDKGSELFLSSSVIKQKEVQLYVSICEKVSITPSRRIMHVLIGSNSSVWDETVPCEWPDPVSLFESCEKIAIIQVGNLSTDRTLMTTKKMIEDKILPIIIVPSNRQQGKYTLQKGKKSYRDIFIACGCGPLFIVAYGGKEEHQYWLGWFTAQGKVAINV